MGYSEEEIRGLVELAKNYNTKAFGELYEIYFDKIYGFIFYKVGDRTEAEDLAEEVFVKALEAIKGFEWRNVPFVSWLFKIAVNVVNDYFRRCFKMTTVSVEDYINELKTTDDPAALAIKKFSQEKLYLAISKLTEIQQEVIILKFLTNLSNTEIARIIGKNEGAVKSLQHRALNALYKVLEGNKDER